MRKRKRAVETVVPDSEALGSCGCVDYHMADCPLMTSRRDFPYDSDAYDVYDRDDDYYGELED